MFKILRIFFATLVIISSSSANADLAIIVHPDYAGGDLTEDMVRSVFLNLTNDFPSGHKARPANHREGSPDRKHFFEYVLKMSESRHKRHWARKQSVGKNSKPNELSSHEEVLKWVANTPLGITYINQNKVNDSVKVLLTIMIFEEM